MPKPRRLLPVVLPFALLAGSCADVDAPQGDDVGTIGEAVAITSFTATYTGQGSNATTWSATCASAYEKNP